MVSRRVHLAGAGEAPGEILLVWTPRGRLSSWDVQSDRSALWTAAANAMLKYIETAMTGSSTFDKRSGTITRAVMETAVSSTSGPLDGHTRYISVVSPWSAGEPTAPANMPEPTL